MSFFTSQNCEVKGSMELTFMRLFWESKMGV